MEEEIKRKESLLNECIPLISDLHSLFKRIHSLQNVTCSTPPQLDSTMKQLEFIASNTNIIKSCLNQQAIADGKGPPTDTLPYDGPNKPKYREYIARWDYQDDDPTILSFNSVR
jgi:hypothetical protein